jgi:hypothetical protein
MTGVISTGVPSPQPYFWRERAATVRQSAILRPFEIRARPKPCVPRCMHLRLLEEVTHQWARRPCSALR